MYILSAFVPIFFNNAKYCVFYIKSFWPSCRLVIVFFCVIHYISQTNWWYLAFLVRAKFTKVYSLYILKCRVRNSQLTDYRTGNNIFLINHNSCCIERNKKNILFNLKSLCFWYIFIMCTLF